MYIPIKVW